MTEKASSKKNGLKKAFSCSTNHLKVLLASLVSTWIDRFLVVLQFINSQLLL
jgi:hypothetical protein